MKSRWTQIQRIDACADQAPHRELATALAPAMGPTTFVRWTVRGEDGWPSWSDAMRRLG